MYPTPHWQGGKSPLVKSPWSEGREQISAAHRLGQEGDKGTQEKLLEKSQDEKCTLSVSIIIIYYSPFGFLARIILNEWLLLGKMWFCPQWGIGQCLETFELSNLSGTGQLVLGWIPRMPLNIQECIGQPQNKGPHTFGSPKSIALRLRNLQIKSVHLKTNRRCSPVRRIQWGPLEDPRKKYPPWKIHFLHSWHCLAHTPPHTHVNYLNPLFLSNFMWLTAFHCNFNTSLPRKMYSRHIKRSWIRNIMCTLFYF